MNMLNKINTLLFIAIGVLFIGCADDGKNGLDGTEFDGLTEYGSVKMTLSGKRSDGIAFNETVEFPYSSIIADDGSSVFVENGRRAFEIMRYQAVPNTDDNTSYVSLDSHETTPGTLLSYVGLSVSFTTADFKYFNISFYNVMDQPTEYSYDEKTGALKYRVSGVIPASQNETGYDLTVSADVDVKVFATIN